MGSSPVALAERPSSPSLPSSSTSSCAAHSSPLPSLLVTERTAAPAMSTPHLDPVQRTAAALSARMVSVLARARMSHILSAYALHACTTRLASSLQSSALSFLPPAAVRPSQETGYTG